MSDHGELADQHEKTADGLERESERLGEHADEARSKLESAGADAFVPQSLGDADPGHREPSEAEQDAARREEEAEEAEPETIGESVDQRLGDVELGQGGERGNELDTDPDKTPGGGDVDDPPQRTAGGDADDD